MTRARDLSDLTQSFGARRVSPDERREAVTQMFDRIAPRYDLMNDLMSFGLHRYWKQVTLREMRRSLGGVDGPSLDLAGGTGDLALALQRAQPGQRVIVADASAGMLAVAQARGVAEILHAPAESLPLEPASLALVTLSFGLRNMTDPAQALAEVARVLKPGGTLLLLEFSQPDRWFAPFYALHARLAIPLLGRLVGRDPAAYSYLTQSIDRFPAEADVCRALEAAGLRVAARRRFLFGLAVLHRVVKG